MALDSSVRARIADRDPTSIRITGSEVSLSANRANDLSEIVDIRVPQGYSYVFPTGRPVTMYLMVHEQFTTDGTGGTDEQFSLSNDLVNSPTVADADTSQTSGGAEVDSDGHADLVVYDEGTQKAVVSVDYANNTFTYADADTNSTLDVYYLWGDSSELVARKRSRDLEEYKKTFGSTASRMHEANVFSSEEMQTFSESFQVDAKERLKFLINTGVDLTNWDAIDDDGPNNTSSYSYIQIPAYKLKTRSHTSRPRGGMR